MSKTKIMGVSMVLAGVAGVVACFANGDYTHIGEAIGGIMAGLTAIFARDAIQKVIDKK